MCVPHIGVSAEGAWRWLACHQRRVAPSTPASCAPCAPLRPERADVDALVVVEEQDLAVYARITEAA